MRYLSIKTKVIFWYSFSMVVIIGLVLFILMLAGKRAAEDDAKASLIISTDMAVNNVTISGGRLIIDDDFVYYMDHTWVALYKEDGTLLSGLTPEGFPENVPFQADTIHKAGVRRNTFFIYDRLIENQKVGKIWIRGITPASIEIRDPAISGIIRLFMVALPLLIILSLIGGWLITRRAFYPLKQINDAVAMIQEGNDLKGRIGMDQDGPRDEIHVTAAAFDQMLDRVGESFEREKQFTNDASHELRTPAAVIQAECEYAMENIDNREEVAEALRVIHEQSQKMSSLITQLLMLARADRNAVILKKEPADIGLLAEEAAFSLRREADEKDITITVDAGEGIYCEVDSNLMSRALENLISNAVKYGKAGGTVKIAVKELPEPGLKGEYTDPETTADQAEKVDNRNRRIIISVADDGIGIREEDIDKIWNRFYRASHTGAVPGLGLGLPLVKWIVEAHGGTIDVTSKPGEGTEFQINLIIRDRHP